MELDASGDSMSGSAKGQPDNWRKATRLKALSAEQGIYPKAKRQENPVLQVFGADLLTVESFFCSVASVPKHDFFFYFCFWTVAAVAEHDDHAHCDHH